jgi:hypothetical protein
MEAEMHVSKADQLVERQRAMVEDLRRQRHDTAAAQRLLAQMELSQRLHIDDLDRLLQERNETAELESG